VIYASCARATSLFAAAACATIACATTGTTTAYTPITGIVIASSALVSGYGCGAGDDQVFRYVATISFAASADAAPEAPVTGVPSTNIFDCFTDGVFENLPTSSNGSQAFTVSVFAYNKKSYDQASLPSDLGCVPGMAADGAVCVDGSQSVTRREEELASWTATCTATQLAGVPVLAVCPPLAAPNAAVDGGPRDASVPVDAGAAGADANTTETGAGD
jgi:hypothetical protein